jgi:type IV secretory pathway VirB10-like protein
MKKINIHKTATSEESLAWQQWQREFHRSLSRWGRVLGEADFEVELPIFETQVSSRMSRGKVGREMVRVPVDRTRHCCGPGLRRSARSTGAPTVILREALVEDDNVVDKEQLPMHHWQVKEEIINGYEKPWAVVEDVPCAILWESTRQRHTERETERQRERQTDRDRERQGERERETERETETERQRETETDRDREREREKDTERQRQRQRVETHTGHSHSLLMLTFHIFAQLSIQITLSQACLRVIIVLDAWIWLSSCGMRTWW